MFYVKNITNNVLNINNSNHRRLCNITENIVKQMKDKSSNFDQFKLKNILSIYVNDRISAMTSSEINYIIYDYGFDNTITNYKKNYKIIDMINTKMLIYNLIYNNYFEIIDLKKKKAIDTISNYIKASKDRQIYNKNINIKRESKYLIEKINNEINGDDAKLILNTIVEKFINRKIKHINKNQ
jgi:hypothetical protein